MTIETIRVPDLGGAETVEVIEIYVTPGDKIELEQALIVLESDKATMDVPSSKAGVVKQLLLKEGDSVSEGSAILEIEVSVESGSEVGGSEVLSASTESEKDETVPNEDNYINESSDSTTGRAATLQEQSLNTTSSTAASVAMGGLIEKTMTLPDVGSEEAVEVIDLVAAPGDTLSEGDSIVVVETDKATMEVPISFDGKLIQLLVNVGDKIKSGADIAIIAIASDASSSKETIADSVMSPPQEQVADLNPPDSVTAQEDSVVQTKKQLTDSSSDISAPIVADEVYAGPASRALARELGVSLSAVTGTGPRGRILKENISAYVKQALKGSEVGVNKIGLGLPSVPDVDFSKFGEIEVIPLQKIQKLTAINMHRSWVNVPHVTQFDEADITELEVFRQSLKAEAENRETRLTPLPFLLKACARALVANPEFNRSITSDGETFIQKKYVHIGMAVDTPRGLVVPVIRNVDQKGLWQLAAEVNAMAQNARDGKLTAIDMQGGCFTISSLGAVGGNGFTPIVNTPEAAILGVSRSQVKPIWNGAEFVPRTMLPLSVSYDHRVINGAGCGRFFTYLLQELSDIRRLSL